MRPSRRLLQLLVAWTLLGVLVSALPVTTPAWMAAGAVLGLGLAVDALDLWQVPALTATRTVPVSMEKTCLSTGSPSSSTMRFPASSNCFTQFLRSTPMPPVTPTVV